MASNIEEIHSVNETHSQEEIQPLTQGISKDNTEEGATDEDTDIKQDPANSGEMQMPAIPDLAVDINVLDDEVKQKILDYLQEEKIKDIEMNVSAGSKKGDNFFGFIRKVVITGTKNGTKVTLNWIVKSAPLADMYRKALNVELVYGREVYIYEKVLPAFKEFQETRSILEPFDNYPNFIFSFLKPLKETLVMEDMKNIGYIMKNKMKPLDYNHAKLAMKTYGKLHAISYAMRDQRPDEFSKITENVHDVILAVMDRSEIFRLHQPLILSLLNAFNPKTDVVAIEKYKKFADKFIDIYDKAMSALNEYSVIGHSDSWVNNILWKYDDPENPNRPTKLCLLDWQIARYGSPTNDLHYFFFLCTDKALRDKYYHTLIKLYYYSLCSTLNELGCDPEKLIPFEALQAEFKKNTAAILYLALIVILMTSREASEMPDFDTNVTEEDMAQFINVESKNVNIINERVRGIILDCLKWGYLDVID